MKAEWLAAYVAAWQRAFSAANIAAAWRAAGLLLFDPEKVIHRCNSRPSQINGNRSPTPITTSPLEQIIVNSSLSDAVALWTGNTELLGFISTHPTLNTPAKKWIKQLTTSAERLFARASILQQGMDDIQKTLSNRK